MADPQTPAAPPKTGGEAVAAAMDAARSAADTGVRQAKDAARITDAGGKAAADNLRTTTETSQEALRAGGETGAGAFENLAQTWSRALAGGPAATDGQPAQNVRAFSEASTALAKGAQDASQAWLELTQKAMRTNLEAFGRLSGCRTVQDLVSVQSHLIRENLQTAIEGGEAIARAQSEAIREASRLMQAQAR